MHKRHLLVSGLTLFLFSIVGLMTAQEAPQGKNAKRRKANPVSPHETKSWVLKGQTITISYGRPYKKGRVLFGGLEPWGKVWRTGADDATTLTTSGELMLGGLHVVKGTYGLFTIPNEKEWTLVLNKVWDQWGAFQYDPSQDYGRTPMRVSTAKTPYEQLTIDIEKKSDDLGDLKISWGETTASVMIQAH